VALTDEFGGFGGGGTLFRQDPQQLALQELDLGGGASPFDVPAAPQASFAPTAGAPAGPSTGCVLAQTGASAAGGAAVGGPVGAAVAGGLALVGGLLGQAGAAKRQQRELKARGEQQALETQKQASQALTAGTQSALRDILAGLSRSLG